VNLAQAKEVAAISVRNSKMPGSTFAQDSFACHVGSRLAKVEGSICSKCYARRIQSMRPSVHKGWVRNFEEARKWIAENPAQWVKACAFQILHHSNKSGEAFHRWFDSGDLDSLAQLKAIVEVAKATPQVSHWLPTREVGIVQAYLKEGLSFPVNFVVRVSSPMIGDKPLTFPNTSTVHLEGKEAFGHACPARNQGNACGACRACWNPSVANVSYPKH